MEEVIIKLEQLLKSGEAYFTKTPIAELSYKASPEKWSKQEVLGHLIDSAIYNLQRFTEIQFQPKPFPVDYYERDTLVKVNKYQEAELAKLVEFWISINTRIKDFIEIQTAETLNFKVQFGTGETADLRFLMTDYVDHIEHHFKLF